MRCPNVYCLHSYKGVQKNESFEDAFDSLTLLIVVPKGIVEPKEVNQDILIGVFRQQAKLK